MGRASRSAALNDTVEQQAATLGWTVVGGIEEGFRLHGYCSTSPWMVRIGESFLRQMDHMGTAHPNVSGHETYRDRIFAALRDAFYPGSTPTALAPARVDRRPSLTGQFDGTAREALDASVAVVVSG